jgi:eukaryotic-like serine/threonine-protein kinase
VRLVGEGGMGAVYEAEHPVIRRKVAVKVLRRELAVDGVLVRRFINEARATNEIRHPGIIEIIDVGMFPDGVPYLIMEMLEGESLARRLERLHWLSLDAALDFALQAASALFAAHSHGIIHRDLKPDNIFLVEDQRFAGRELVKILDFGIAKLRGDITTNPVDTKLGSVIGTPAYMSPEQCRGIPDAVDHRTDIYSLGIILYEMLCGEPPFVAPGPGDLMMMHMTTTPVPPSERRPEVPPSVEEVILTMLAKHRDERFDSMADFGAALGRATPIASMTPAPSNILISAADRIALEEMHRSTLADNLPPALEASSAPPPTSLDHTTDFGPGDIKSHAAPSKRGPVVVGALAAVAVLAGLGWMRFGAQNTVRSTAAVAPALARSEIRPEPELQAPPPAPTAIAQPPAIESPAQPVQRPPTAAESQVSSRRAAPPARRPTAPPMAPKAAATPSEVAAPRSQPTPSDGAGTRSQSAASTPAVEPGYLSFDSMPWSEVYLGSKHLGTTPLIRISIPPGRHVLTLKNPEVGTSTSYVVEIASGKAVSRFVGWEKE